MKNIPGKLIGFTIGMGGFLLLFNLLVLGRTDPADELAPGIVVVASVLSGVFFAFIGSWVQGYFKNRAT